MWLWRQGDGDGSLLERLLVVFVVVVDERCLAVYFLAGIQRLLRVRRPGAWRQGEVEARVFYVVVFLLWLSRRCRVCGRVGQRLKIAGVGVVHVGQPLLLLMLLSVAFNSRRRGWWHRFVGVRIVPTW